MNKLILSFLISICIFGEPNTSMFAPLPDRAENSENPITSKKLELGKKLYFEKMLSLNNDLSCNSCHQLDTFGVDNKPTSDGHKNQKGDRNSPTVYNSALHMTQFWDGRAKDVEEQALGPVLNPVEMAMPNAEEVIKRLQANEEYSKLFKEVFPEDKNITFVNVGKAIAAYERTLLTPSRFDDYLKGDKKALTEKEKKGLQLFVNTGCTACHSGVLLGAQMYQKLGLVKPYPTKDIGRAKATKLKQDEYFFKVPSLRNIEKTAPYFHDGSVKTLDEAVSKMAEYQLGRNLSKEEVNSIIDFLKSLTAKELKY